MDSLAVKDTDAPWIDEDCLDELHDWCMGDHCECSCHQDFALGPERV